MTKRNEGDQRVRDLILWARAEKIVLTRLRIGDVELELADTHLAGKLAGPKPGRTEAEAVSDLYRHYGGAALAQLEDAAETARTANMQDAEDENEA